MGSIALLRAPEWPHSRSVLVLAAYAMTDRHPGVSVPAQLIELDGI
jgi:hypothetical protein